MNLTDFIQPGQEPLDAYDAGIAAGRWQEDGAQRRVLRELDRLHLALLAATPGGLFDRVLARFAKPKTIRGLYIHGDVGRGKTFLMDLFFASLPFPEKKRLHFHHFMQQVHAGLAQHAHVEEPLQHIAEQWAKACRVLCFDEFFVSDIGDAMLLGNLLKPLFERGVTLVATSNVVPADLYKDGLQRAGFLPAIALLETHCEVVRLDAAQDYRLRALTQAAIYLTPYGTEADDKLARLFDEVATAAPKPNLSLQINGRAVLSRCCASDVAWFNFAELCESARSAADYIELAREFHTVLLSDVPQFTVNSEDPARRFMFLVDEFYDRRVKLLLSAAALPNQLYRGRKFTMEFKRTASRLTEMQTTEYLAQAHLA